MIRHQILLSIETISSICFHLLVVYFFSAADREILRALARLEAKMDGIGEELKKQGRVVRNLVQRGSGASAVEPPEQDTLADALPLKTAQEFRALEVLLQEKAKQQSLVCMNQHKYQRTVLFRYYRTTICSLSRDNY